MAQGSVRKKGNSWYYRYYEDGKQIERKGGSTKAEALKSLNEVLNRQYKGYKRPEEMELGEYLHMWIDDYITPTRSVNTADKYLSAIDKKIIPQIGNIRLCDLGAIHIENLLRSLRKERLSNTTIQKYYGVINTALNKAVTLRLIYDNPCKFIDKPKRDKYKASILTFDEINMIYSRLDNNDWEDYIFRLALEVTLETGLRRGELCGLCWDDVDFDECSINISKSLKREKNDWVVGSLKTEGSERTLPLSSSLIEKLRKHKKRQFENKLKYGELYTKNMWETKEYDLLFTWCNGKFILPSNFYRRLKRLCSYCKIEKNIRWHDLRHTNATLLLESDVNLKVVQERLGHTLLQTTSDLYTHVTKKLNRSATDKIAKLIESN